MFPFFGTKSDIKLAGRIVKDAFGRRHDIDEFLLDRFAFFESLQEALLAVVVELQSIFCKLQDKCECIAQVPDKKTQFVRSGLFQHGLPRNYQPFRLPEQPVIGEFVELRSKSLSGSLTVVDMDVIWRRLWTPAGG